MTTGPDPLQPFRLDGKTAIVTGAGSGIGRATAVLFSQAGARLVAADLDQASATATADLCEGDAIGMRTNVADEAEVASLFLQVMAQIGPCDIIVNNAACRSKAAFMEMGVAEWDEMHAVNARGTFLCMRAAIRQMQAARRNGSIVNISSVSAAHPTIFGNAHYDSSKAGVDALTRAAAIEFAKDGIRVNSVRPGGTDTGGRQSISSNFAPIGPMVGPGRIALGRLAQPIETARAILFLASEAASYITGQHLAVDGGFLVS